jgi:hypothetical protein
MVIIIIIIIIITKLPYRVNPAPEGKRDNIVPDHSQASQPRYELLSYIQSEEL